MMEARVNHGRVGVDIEKSEAFSYRELHWLKIKGLRNGNWWRLERLEKGLFKATLSLAKLRGKVVNPALIAKVKEIASRMLETVYDSLIKKGEEKAKQLFDLYSKNGVFEWLPQMRGLLEDKNYLLWLGLSTLNFEGT